MGDLLHLCLGPESGGFLGGPGTGGALDSGLQEPGSGEKLRLGGGSFPLLSDLMAHSTGGQCPVDVMLPSPRA